MSDANKNTAGDAGAATVEGQEVDQNTLTQTAGEGPGEGTATPVEEEQAAAQEESKVQPGVIKKINKLTRRNYETQSKLDEQLAENEKLRGELTVAKTATATAPEDRPKRDAFDDEDDYQAELATWAARTEISKADIKTKADTDKAAQDFSQKSFEDRRDTVMDAGVEKYDDFFDKVNSLPAGVFNVDVVATILETENAQDVAYHLAENQEEAIKIARMAPMARAVAVGRISAGLATAPPKKTTKAPPPIKPGGTNNFGTVPDDKLSDEEYFAKQDAAMIAKG